IGVIRVTGARRSAIWLAVILAATVEVWAAAGLTIALTVQDQLDRPAPGIRVELLDHPAGNAIASAVTDATGRVSFSDLESRPYQITIVREGFEGVRREVDLTLGESASVEVTLVPSMTRRDSVEVKGTADAIEQGGAAPVEISGKLVKDLPNRPA